MFFPHFPLIRPRSNAIDKVIGRLADAVGDMEPGSVIGISGFGVVHGFPVHLIAAVRDHGARDLVVVTNSLGREPTHPVPLVSSCQVRKLVAAFSVIERDARGLVLRECALGFAPDDMCALTAAPLTVELWT
jgi:acyl CoA:acetate/3-ketoacid CoA transferase alpha subunit